MHRPLPLPNPTPPADARSPRRHDGGAPTRMHRLTRPTVRESARESARETARDLTRDLTRVIARHHGNASPDVDAPHPWGLVPHANGVSRGTYGTRGTRGSRPDAHPSLVRDADRRRDGARRWPAPDPAPEPAPGPAQERRAQ
jgi:hypothetical protein